MANVSLEEFLVILGVASSVAGFLGALTAKREVRAHEKAAEDKWDALQETVADLGTIQVASMRANYAASDEFANAMDDFYPDIVQKQIKPITRNGHRDR